MGGEINETYIGNVKFDGVKILKSEVKKTSEGNINCVWTDAGYLEYKDQPLLLYDGIASIHAEVKKIKNRDMGENANLLQILRLTEGRLDLESDNYMAVSHMGDSDRDYSSFTINAKNGKNEYVMTSNSNVTISADENDTVAHSNNTWGLQKDNTYIEHSPIKKDFIEYKE